MKLKGAIFDMDGTIVEVPYDWPRIKEVLGTQGKPILSYLHCLKEPEKSQKLKILKKYEGAATESAVLKKGMHRFLAFLEKNGIHKALVTNNSRKNVRYLLRKFNLKFDYVVSRESGLWKPSGAPLEAVLKRLKIDRDQCCIIGDSYFDIKAAEDAGIRKIFILSQEKERFSSTPAAIFADVGSLQKNIEKLIKAGARSKKSQFYSQRNMSRNG